MCRFNTKQIINHFLNGNILTDFCSKSHELSRVKSKILPKYILQKNQIALNGKHYPS